MDYLIDKNTDLQTFSAVDVSFDWDKLMPSFPKAIGDIKAIISPEIYNMALAHKTSENFGDETFALLNELVEKIQAPLWNLAMYHHFIWLQIRVSSNKLSVLKSDREQALNKGQIVEAKETLMELAHNYISDLIDFLNQNDTEIKSGEEPVWSKTKQYTNAKNMLFDDYRDFDFSYSIDNSAAFYFRASGIIRKVIAEDAVSRIGSIADLLNPPAEEGEESTPNEELIKRVKDCVAIETVSRAIRQLPYAWLPGSIRQTIDRENYASSGRDETTVREKIGREVEQMAQNEWSKLDLFLQEPEENEITGEIEYPTTPTLDENNKHATLL